MRNWTVSGVAQSLVDFQCSVVRFKLRTIFMALGILITLLLSSVSNAAGLDIPRYEYIGSSEEYVRVYWDCSTDECDLQKSSDGDNWTTVETSDRSRDYEAFRLSTGTYYFRLLQCTLNTYYGNTYRVYCATGQPETLTVRRIPGSSPTPSVPSINTDGSYTVTWSSTSYTDGYKLYERFNGGSWSLIHHSSNRSKSRTNRSVGKYEYRIRSCKYGQCAAYSPIRSVQVKEPEDAPVVSLASRDENGSYSISWTSERYADRYRLQQRVGGGSWQTIQNSSSRSKSFSGKEDNRYTYRVRACNPMGCSSYSAYKAIDVARDPAIPSIDVPGGATDGTFSVSWGKPSANVTQYQFEIKKGSNNWASRSTPSGTSKGVTLGAGTYRFRIRAYNKVGDFPNYSNWKVSGEVVVAKPSSSHTPQLPGSSGNGSYSVNWGATPNTTRYQLIERVGSGTWRTVQNNGSRSRGFSGRGNNVYRYRVRACNRIGCAAYSPVELVNVAHAPGLTSGVRVPSDETDGLHKLEPGKRLRYRISGSSPEKRR